MLAGCLPDPLPVGKIPQLESKIVVASQVVPDQSIVVLVTKSFGALDADEHSDADELLNQIAINDATVIIEGNGFKDTLTFVETGIYASVSVPFVFEDHYTIHIESPTMGKVTASAQVKTQVLFESLSAEIYDTGFDTLATLNYSFQDLPGKNYYMINVQHIAPQDDDESYDFLNPSLFTHLLDDNEESDGQMISDSFKVFFRRDFIPGDTIMVQLSNISQRYYDFLQLRRDTRFNFADFVGEPVNYPTNIVGGLGWFTLHVPDVQFIVVEDD
jgi:hypothetical protein